MQDRIALAKGIVTVGVNDMDFKKTDPYGAQAKALYGKTDAYKEFTQKSANRTAQQEKDLGQQVMDFFVRLGKMRPCDPAGEKAQA